MALSMKKKHVHFTIDVNFASEAENCAFSEKLAVRNRLIPLGSLSVSNHKLLLALLGLAEKIPTSSTSSQAYQYPFTGSFLRNSGQYKDSYCEILDIALCIVGVLTYPAWCRLVHVLISGIYAVG